jgi:hypothetical protein
MTFTIKKLQTEPIKWKRLLKSDKKHAQMHYWFEMAENYKNELEQIEIDRENRLKQLKEEEAKARAEKEEAEKKAKADKEAAAAMCETLPSLPKLEMLLLPMKQAAQYR